MARSFLALLAVSLLASLGRFGIGWLISEIEFFITGAQPNRFGLGDPVGGIYWLCNTLLPGFDPGSAFSLTGVSAKYRTQTL